MGRILHEHIAETELGLHDIRGLPFTPAGSSQGVSIDEGSGGSEVVVGSIEAIERCLSDNGDKFGHVRPRCLAGEPRRLVATPFIEAPNRMPEVQSIVVLAHKDGAGRRIKP
jgi:hypothetical protein